MLFIIWPKQEFLAAACLAFVSVRLLASLFSLAMLCTNKVVCQLLFLLPMESSPLLCTNQASLNARGIRFNVNLAK